MRNVTQCYAENLIKNLKLRKFRQSVYFFRKRMIAFAKLPFGKIVHRRLACFLYHRGCYEKVYCIKRGRALTCRHRSLV